jgi:hypothetical protein
MAPTANESETKRRLTSPRRAALVFAIASGLLAVMELQPSPRGAEPSSDTSVRAATPLDAWLEPVDDETARQGEVEKLIRSCMAERGFRYVPLNWQRIPRTPPAMRLSSMEFLTRFGYGITTRIGNQSKFGQPSLPDPNEKIHADLRGPRREAYERALDGGDRPGVPIRDMNGRIRFRFWPHSCITRATSAVFGSLEDRLRAKALLEPLLDGLHRRVRSHPSVAAASVGWSRCMGKHGLAFGDPDEIRALMLSKLKELESVYRSNRTTVAGRAEFRRTVSIAQVEEMEIARHDARCRVESGINEVLNNVRTTLEREFVDRHKSLLQRVRPKKG